MAGVKAVIWLRDSLKRLRGFPGQVQDDVGFSLYQAQLGRKHSSAKPLRGYKSAGVLEVIDDYDGDTYRCVYTVKFSDAVYVLHAFQRNSRAERKRRGTKSI